MAEQTQNALRLLVESLHRTQDRGLLIEGLAGPRDEGRWNAQGRSVRVLENIGRTRDVPNRIAPRLEGGTYAASREAGAIRLALNQLGTAEFGDRSTVPIGCEEAVVLFGGRPGQRVEDVRVVSRTFLDGPVFHRGRDDIGNRWVELLACLDGLHCRFIQVLWQSPFHHLKRKNVGVKQLLGRCIDEVHRWPGRLVVDYRRDGRGSRRAASAARYIRCLIAHRI